MMKRMLLLALLLPPWLGAADSRGVLRNFPFDSKIVFNSDFSGNHEIYLLSRNQLKKLTDHPACDEWPVPNRGGDRILFSSDRSGNFDIYVLDLVSGQLERLTDDPVQERSPSWSADGQSIFYDLEKPGGWTTMRLDLRSRQKSPLFKDSPFASTIVTFQSPDGRFFFFTAKVLFGWAVAAFDSQTGKYSKLTGRGSCRPKVSPDGTLIAFVGFDDDGHGDVFLMKADGGEKTNLTPQRSEYYDYYPCFSPDGKEIVFSSSPVAKGKTAYQLYTLDIKTRKSQRIFYSTGNNVFPYWFK